MRLINSCSDPYQKGSKHIESQPQPGWFVRVNNYPDIDKKRFGPCAAPVFAAKKPR